MDLLKKIIKENNERKIKKNFETEVVIPNNNKIIIINLKLRRIKRKKERKKSTNFTIDSSKSR